jgi:hypothetical protein
VFFWEYQTAGKDQKPSVANSRLKENKVPRTTFGLKEEKVADKLTGSLLIIFVLVVRCYLGSK